MDLNDPVAVALLADEALRRSNVPHALYGGLLLAAYGDPRETRDADVAVIECSAQVTSTHSGARASARFPRLKRCALADCTSPA